MHPCLFPLRAGQKRLFARRRHLSGRAPCRRLQPLKLGPELRQRLLGLARLVGVGLGLGLGLGLANPNPNQLRQRLLGVARLRLQRARLVRVRVSLVRVRGLA